MPVTLRNKGAHPTLHQGQDQYARANYRPERLYHDAQAAYQLVILAQMRAL